jgi:post-segregation antitoxin (ccd killing protein)
MTEYVDSRTGLLMKQTTIYLPEELLKWARARDIKLGKMLSNAIILEKNKFESGEYSGYV